LLLRHELLRGLLRLLRHVLLTKRRKRLSACRRAKLLACDVKQLLVLPLAEQSLPDLTDAEVGLSAQVLVCDAAKALICGLAKVLLAKTKQTLRCTLQGRKLLLRLLGLRQTTACQTQEAVLHGLELRVQLVAGTRHTALRVGLELRLAEARRDADRAEAGFFSRKLRCAGLGVGLSLRGPAGGAAAEQTT
jgi:hypothetical protein